MHTRYNAVLDIFALTALYAAEGVVLAQYTQYVACIYLSDARKRSLLDMLVQCACDLGCVDVQTASLHQQFL